MWWGGYRGRRPARRNAKKENNSRAWYGSPLAEFLAADTNSILGQLTSAIRYMDRHSDWAVIVCLVGGGQEIHTGEAGIGEWIEAITRDVRHWHVYLSPLLSDHEYAAGRALELAKAIDHVDYERDLHLAVSMRSFRAEKVSSFVKAIVDCQWGAARELLASFSERFRIVMTRDLATARRWIRDNARGTERYGIVASSKAMRLKPHALDVRVAVNPIQWFLNDRDDVRSSCYLEDCATEFQVQGLELDWTCVSWDGDLRCDGEAWTYHDFRGHRWVNIQNSERQAYLRNAYRVLLTRARQGMVLFIPPGDHADPTRKPRFYDQTFQQLAEVGVPVLTT